MTPFDEQQLREKTEVLFGGRGSDPRKAAVRLSDLDAILQLPSRLKSSKAAGTTPTKDEFDALVDDVHTIFRRLAALSQAIQQRIIK